jgi:hypothetical protein
MGQTDIRAAVGTIAAFAAAQDIYKSAPSSTREVAGVLANAWWVRQLSGNVVTVAVGHSTRQFVKLIDGTYQTLGAGAPATLAVTGTRAPYEERCLEHSSIPAQYALTRGWSYQNMSFAVTNAGGDVQNFGFWKSHYWDGENYCGNQKGFRMTGWTFPHGPSIALTYLHARQSDEAQHRVPLRCARAGEGSRMRRRCSGRRGGPISSSSPTGRGGSGWTRRGAATSSPTTRTEDRGATRMRSAARRRCSMTGAGGRCATSIPSLTRSFLSTTRATTRRS